MAASAQRPPRTLARHALAALAALGLALAGCAAPPAPPSPSATAAPPAPPSPSATTAPTALPSPSATAAPTATSAPAATTAPTATAALDDLARADALVALIGQLRAERGLPPYQRSAELDAAARAHSCDMAASGLIGHVGSDGRTLEQRVPPGLPWAWYSESVAAGSDDAATIVAMWMDEPPDGWHRRNILDADRVAIGAGHCARADDPTGNRHYWAIIVARP